MADIEDNPADMAAALPMAERAAVAFPPNAVHLVRTSQQLTMQLSQMADQKASILMGATFVVFTLAVGQARVGAGALAAPLTVLATFSFLSALLAISAVLPRVGKLPAHRHAAADQGNILFFGQFSALSEDEFIAAVKQRLLREEDIYETMLRDTYQNGVVLARRKYRLLAHAYRLFVVGLSLTFLVFLWDMIGHWRG